MRISDWSSDVCSSDLSAGRDRRLGLPPRWRWRSGPSRACRPSRPHAAILDKSENVLGTWHSVLTMEIIEEDSSLPHREWVDGRSDKCSVGREWVSTCEYGG